MERNLENENPHNPLLPLSPEAMPTEVDPNYGNEFDFPSDEPWNEPSPSEDPAKASPNEGETFPPQVFCIPQATTWPSIAQEALVNNCFAKASFFSLSLEDSSLTPTTPLKGYL